MKSKYFFSMVLILSFFILTPLYAFTGIYEEKIQAGENVIADFKVWTHEGQFRMQNNLASETDLTIKNEEGTFRYLPDQKTAMKLPDADEGNDLLKDLGDFSEFLSRNQAVLTGQEVYSGIECEVYEFKDPNGFTNKVWLDKEKRLPLKVSVSMPAGDMEVQMHYLQVGGEIDPEIFKIPDDVKKLDLQSVYQQMQAQMSQ